MKVLITGSYGIVGSELVNILKRNYTVAGIGKRTKDENCSIYKQVQIENRQEVEEFFKENSDIEVIVHCAALAHNKGNDLSYDKFKAVNFQGTKNLVDGAKTYLKGLKKFIFISTISVYGEKLEKSIYREEDQCTPNSPYAVTKKMAEDYVKQNLDNYTILRLSPVYTESFRLNIDRRTKFGNTFYRVGNGNCRLSLLNVKNIQRAVEYFVSNADSGVNETYNLADSKVYTYKYLISRLNNGRSLVIPSTFIKLLYHINKHTLKKQFIDENSIKLVSDNIYDTGKISSLVALSYEL